MWCALTATGAVGLVTVSSAVRPLTVTAAVALINVTRGSSDPVRVGGGFIDRDRVNGCCKGSVTILGHWVRALDDSLLPGEGATGPLPGPGQGGQGEALAGSLPGQGAALLWRWWAVQGESVVLAQGAAGGVQGQGGAVLQHFGDWILSASAFLSLIPKCFSLLAVISGGLKVGMTWP